MSRLVPLNDVCRVDRKTLYPDDFEARQRPYLSLEFVDSGSGAIDHSGLVNNGEAGSSTTFAFDHRHVLYGKLRPYLNKVALPDFRGRCTTELIPLLPGDDLDREYLAWFLRRPATVEMAMRGKTGSRMPRANMKNLLEMKVPLPPLSEQRAIAKRLSEQMEQVDAARQAAQARLAAAEALHEAGLRHLMGMEVSWPTRRLGDVTSTSSGSTPRRSRDDYYGGATPWVKTGELKDGVITDTEEKVTDLAIREARLKKLPAGTLLIAMYGQGQTRGRTGLLGIEATTNQACFAVHPAPELDPTFLQLWFRSKYKQLRHDTEARGGNQPNLNGNVLRNLRIPLPDKSTQVEIVQRFQEQDEYASEVTELVERQSNAIEMLPSALLWEVFGDSAE